ncbi:MAG TPA: serine/threonine-protein kinase [Myxococcota bacterium]
MATRIVPLDEPTGAHQRAPPRTRTPTPSLASPSHSSASVKTDRGVPSLTGMFSPGFGARLLMDLFVDGKSGRLVVENGGSLFFLAGEPVHAAPQNAALLLEKRLTARGALAGVPKTPPPLPSSRVTNPLLALSRRSHPVVVLEALRDEVRELCSQLLAMQFGEWAFYDDDDFAEAVPLTAVNPFGFALEARRKTLAPDALLRLGEELAPQFPSPKGGFANVAPRLRSFTGGVDIGPLVDGTTPASEIYRATRLDPIIGGLVLSTLADTGLIELSSFPAAASVRDRRRAQTSALPALVAADAQQLSQLASLPGKSGVEILALYLEIKPERADDAILGVDARTGPAAIERGYQNRLAELDPRAIPAGANRPYLLARAEELRAKVDRAYRALTSTQHKAAPAAYEMLERIGEGGMAEVFRGRAAEDGKLVAIKRILPKLRDDADFARQFLDEARLARRIQHPNVVRIYTVGKSGDDLYLAMELVDGFDLGELLRRSHKLKKAVPVDVACRVIADACGGLHAAHTAHDRSGAVMPILHRDVSTQNILVGKNGDVKLTDFGIAKALDAQHDPNEEGQVKGKVPYLAPELIDGHPASVRSDVYAMAMSLYATLVKLPFSRGDAFATMRAIANEPLPRASSFRPDVPPAVDAVLLRAAAHNPDERHASAQELQLDLEETLTQSAVDVGRWVRVFAAQAPAPVVEPVLHGQTTRTIFEDVEL